MNLPEQAIEAAQEEIGSDLAAGVGNDDDQRAIIRTALEAAVPFIAAQALREAAPVLWSEPYENFTHRPHQINNLHEAALVNGGSESASEWLLSRATTIESEAPNA